MNENGNTKTKVTKATTAKKVVSGNKNLIKNNSLAETLSGSLGDLTQNVSNPERIVSAVAGGGLIAYGLKRKDWLGALLGVVGGGLALRGATGHCQVYDALDIDTNENSLYES